MFSLALETFSAYLYVSSVCHITVLKKSSYPPLHGAFLLCRSCCVDFLLISVYSLNEGLNLMCKMIGTFNICANFMVVYFCNLVDQHDYLAWLLTRESTCTRAWRQIDFAFYTVLLCVRKLYFKYFKC